MESYILYILTVIIPLVWSPGPNNIMCATVGAKQGFLRSISFIAGLNIPIFFYTISTGFGLGIFIAKYSVFQIWLPIAAAFYVIYLGLKLIIFQSEVNAEKSTFRIKDGFFISLMNFKIITVLVLFFINFTSTNGSYIHVFLLSFVFLMLCVCGHIMWNMVGVLSKSLLKNSKFFMCQNYLYGLILITTGITMMASSY